jgi:hypothetical protein
VEEGPPQEATCTIENYPRGRALASHAPMREGSMETRLVLVKAEDDGKHSGGACVKQDLAEESKSNFKKFNPKSLTNRQERW